MGKKLYTRQKIYSEIGLSMPKKSGVYNLGEYCNHYCQNVFFNLLVPLHQEICDWDQNSFWNSSSFVTIWVQIFSSSVISMMVSIWSGRTGIPAGFWFWHDLEWQNVACIQDVEWGDVACIQGVEWGNFACIQGSECFRIQSGRMSHVFRLYSVTE